MQALLKTMSSQEIKEQMFDLAARALTAAEQTVYGWLFDELESRLCDVDFDAFLDQVDAVIAKRRAA